MGKYKVCAYAICKNEEKFVRAWHNRVKEADLVLVGDTGSTDNTVGLLRDLGAEVHVLDMPYFRFDEARNKTLALIPEDYDICISSDMDELISAGWREKLEAAWEPDTTRGACKFVWSHNPDGSPGVTYLHQRIHQRHDYLWKYPTHEIVSYTGKGREKQTFIEGMQYDHYPDKTKNRSFNLPLLKIAVKEFPHEVRNYHYLGREYMYLSEWDNCINTLTIYLNLPNANWNEERAASMRFIARAYKNKGDKDNAKVWLYKAMAEYPNVREPYIEFAMLSYDEKDWESVVYYTRYALRITERHYGYSSESFAWDHTPYDLLAISYYWLDKRAEARRFSEEALKISPDNERLKNNHKIYSTIEDIN